MSIEKVNRAGEIKKFLQLIDLKESFSIKGERGIGKSKFIKFITSDQNLHQQYLSKNCLVCLLDIKTVYKKTPENLIQAVTNALDPKLSTQDLNTALKCISKMLKQYDLIYIVLDDFESLNGTPKEVSGIIRVIRDEFKHQVCFVYVFVNESLLDKRLLSILDTAGYSLELKRLNSTQMEATIHEFENRYNIKLSQQELQQCINSADGIPLKARNLVIAKALEGELPNDENFDQTKLLQKLELTMTKNEFLVFKKLLSNDNAVVTKDEIAQTLSPESEGLGVSDAAISQIIKRIRKALVRSEVPIKIETKRGVGYYIVTKKV